MSGALFNIWMKINQIKDALIEKGPAAFRRTADILQLLEQAARQAADYIDMGGIQKAPVGENAIPGSGLEHDKAKEQLNELLSVYRTADAYVSGAAAAPADAAAGPFTDFLGSLSPEFKTYAWGVLKLIIGQLLAKSGVALPGLAPTHGTGSTAGHPHRKTARETEKA